MNRILSSLISAFARRHLDLTKPLLLGLSGGPDSMALLHLLLEVKGLKLAIAHVDHGWRIESQEESQQLASLSERLHLPFHGLRLDVLEGNQEDSSRKARYRFFAELCKRHDYQGVVVGHHAGDQAETVLKRVFEGASLPLLKAIQAVAVIEGVTVFRPFLKVEKQQIIMWLKQRGIDFFQDPTNEDLSYLRSRMRQVMMPEIECVFGKKIQSNLSALAEEAGELDLFLKELMAPALKEVVNGPMGAMLNFNLLTVQHPYLIESVIQELAKETNLPLSREQRKILIDAVVQKKANRRVVNGRGSVYADRGALFFSSFIPIEPEEVLALHREEDGRWGCWDIQTTHVDQASEQITGWQKLWQGNLRVLLPSDGYQLMPAKAQSPHLRGTTLDRWWNRYKVPAFLRHCAPVVCRDGLVIHEFLTGVLPKMEAESPNLRVDLAINRDFLQNS